MDAVRWVAVRAGVVLAVLLLLVIAVHVVLLRQASGTAAPWARSGAEDALWMGHAWVDGRNGQAELDRLADRIEGSGIKDVYVHIGPLDEDGTLDASKHPEAERFLQRFRATVPEVEVSAWIGQVVGDDAVDLGRGATRAAIVKSAQDAVRLGFDGVHYNFEPVSSGDDNLLRLLRRTGARLPDRASLSMAVPQVEPTPGLRLPLHVVLRHDKYWSTGYLREVARELDQVAVMSYDTGVQLEKSYTGYVARQTRLALEAVPDDVRLLMGAPAFHTDNFGHRESAETVAAAVQGARLALSDGENPRDGFGVALYVDFAATDEDWKDYAEGWVRPPRTARS